MRIFCCLRRGALAAGAMAMVTGFEVAPASAQLFWDWGGGSMVGGSGREIVSFSPQHAKGQIIVSFGDRRLYYVTQPGQALSYPIAIPREQSRWQGVTSVSDKRVNPSWTPTPTMVAENPRLPRWVPGGHPMNPLGVRALYLGSSAYRIHGTDAPWTIGSAVSKGCIRMYNQDVLDLYPRIPVGTKVTVTWDRFTAVASNSAPSPKPSAYSSPSGSNPPASGGGFFSLFGDDDLPPGKPRRPIRSKHPRSASTE
ncbi:MAG: L,D-transpeptidase [Hyphomicrobiaceae bacterium]